MFFFILWFLHTCNFAIAFTDYARAVYRIHIVQGLNFLTSVSKRGFPSLMQQNPSNSTLNALFTVSCKVSLFFYHNGKYFGAAPNVSFIALSVKVRKWFAIHTPSWAMRWALSMRRKLRWCMPNWWTTPLPMPSTTWAPTPWGLWSITHPSPWPKCCLWWTRSSIRCTRLGPAWTIPAVASLRLCHTRTQSSRTQPMALSPWSGLRIVNRPETSPRATADRIRPIRQGAAPGTSSVEPGPGRDPARGLAGQRKAG